jgi:hypothetical protein
MQVIAYGIPADEYLCIDKDTTIESVRMFAKVMIRVFAKVNVLVYGLSLRLCSVPIQTFYVACTRDLRFDLLDHC